MSAHLHPLAGQPARFVRITARWYVRGGIYTDVVVEHRNKGWKPAAAVMLPPTGTATGLSS